VDTLTAMKGVALGKTGTKPAVALSKRAGLMPRSAIREIMSLAAGRSDVIHLEVGEPDFGTPSAIIEQAFAAVRQGATRYSGNAGRPSLRATIAQHASRYGVPVTPERVIVTVGAIGALFGIVIGFPLFERTPTLCALLPTQIL